VRSSIGSSAQREVTAFNDALGQLANANEGLRRVPEGTASHASLLDSRDQALAEISKRLNVTITFGSNGVADIGYAGEPLVTNNNVRKLSVSQNPDGELLFSIAGGGVAVAAPSGGALGGLTDSALVTRDRIEALDNLATRYVTEMNDWHRGGFSAPGVAGQPLLSMGANAGEISLMLSNPALVAGYSAGGVINGNLLALSSLRGSGSIEDVWVGMITQHGSLAASTMSEQRAASSRDLMAQQARSEVVGVNLDREAADLIRLQQAYQGSARVIQVARELVQTIFSIF